MVKKSLILCCLALTIMFACAGIQINLADAEATAEIAMELETGTVLTERNADIQLPMASTTKVLTAIIIIEDCDLDEVITVPDEAVGAEGSSIYLKKDEQIDIRDLLYGLMLRSGNDSAAALAIRHSGSIEKFAVAMNEKAKLIGAENSNFTNPSGLPDKEHYTTARDLCKIARYAMQNEMFKEIVSTKNYNGKFRNYSNKNKMLYNYEGATGVKTGYTVKAGRCLVSSAERNGMSVVSVVLNCPDMYERSTELLDYSLNNFRLVKIDENTVFMSDRVLCKASKMLKFVIKKDEKLDIQVKPYKDLRNIKRGDLVAELKISGQNGLILSENLYSIIDRK